MHILYEIEHLSTVGGIERILIDKANYIGEEWGWHVSVVVLLEEEPITAYPISSKVQVHYLNVKSKGIRMCIESLWKLNKIVRKLNPDIYVTFQTIGAMSCLLRTHNIPTIYEAHGIRTSMQHPLAMFMAERFSDCVVTLTNKNTERYAKASKVEKIPNFTTMESEDVPDYSRKHCISLGRFEPEKNYGRMIKLWSSIHVIHPDWVLDIYGEGSERESLQHQIDDNGLSRSVMLHGVTKESVKALCSASIFLLTSRFEGFGLVLVEASVCSLPCVAFDCPDGPCDIIENGKTGYLVPYDDDKAFIEKLSLLMDNESLRKQMGETAKVTAQRFRPAPIMEKWQNLFNSLLH